MDMPRLLFTASCSTPCGYYYRERDVSAVVHADDFLCIGPPQQLDWLYKQLTNTYALKKKTLEASLRSSLLCNVAVCQVKLEQWEEAITAASECLRGDGAEAKTRAKALLFRSRAYRRSPHRCGADGPVPAPSSCRSPHSSRET